MDPLISSRGAGWRQLDRAALDAAYNNGAAVADSAAITRDWQRRSQSLRERHAAHEERRYGQAERCRVDLLPAADPRAPLVVFFHGGYWQMRAKEDFTFVAEGPLAAGLSVALVGYTLAPQATLAGIVDECRQAVAFLARETEASTLLLCGWSAGAHLAVSSIAGPRVAGALAISGVYALEPLRHSYLNEALRLDEAMAAACSPALQADSTGVPLTVAWGDAELPALQWQSLNLLDKRRAATALAVTGAHHFSVLEALASPEGVLTKALAAMAG